MKSWYAVQCKPSQDARAQEHLDNQQFEVFRPLAKVRKRCRGQLKQAIESLFPRYLFVRLDDTCDTWSAIRSTRGVAGLVKFGEYPAVVPEPVITDLREHTDEDRCVDLTRPKYVPNQRIRILDGPFRGYEGLFHARRGEDRVILLLEIMQQAQRLEFPDRIVELA